MKGWRGVAWIVGIGAVVALGLLIWLRGPIGTIGEAVVDVLASGDLVEAMGTAEGVAGWIRDNPDDVAIVSYEVGPDGLPVGEVIRHRGEAVHGIASTAKIVVAAAYALAVAEGRLDPQEAVPLADWEAWWLPHTDGGAHEASLKHLGRTAGSDGSVTLQDVAFAMIRYSDNAATDFLSDRLGTEALEAVAEPVGIEQARTVVDILGRFLAWGNHEVELTSGRVTRLLAQPVPDREAVYRKWSDRYRSDAAFRDEEIALRASFFGAQSASQQGKLAKGTGPRGTADGYARAMAGIAAGTWPTPEAAPIVSDLLQWPMQFESNQARYARFGTKGGSLVGIVTEASFVQPKDGPTRVVVLFLADVPLGAWLGLMQGFGHQALMRDWAADPATLAELVAQL